MPQDKHGSDVFVGAFVRVLSLPEENFGGSVEVARQSAIGRVCRVAEPYEGTSENGIQISTGEYLVHYAPLTSRGIEGIGFYVAPNDVEVVQASEEMLLLYSQDIWQLVRPFGETQDTPTFAKLVAAFGLSPLKERPKEVPKVGDRVLCDDVEELLDGLPVDEVVEIRSALMKKQFRLISVSEEKLAEIEIFVSQNGTHSFCVPLTRLTLDVGSPETE
jgi:hypothetical protein